MYFLDFFFFLHQGVRDPDRFSDKSRGRRQIYKLMCLAALIHLYDLRIHGIATD